MHSNLIGIFLSFLFIFGLNGIATIGQRQALLSKEGTKKLVHIGVSHWWLIAMVFFDGAVWAAVIPACFVLLNYLSYRKHLFSAMERDSGKGNLGTVYYPMSLLILALVSFGPLEPHFGALGIFIMGYGDGLAAVVDERFGRIRFSVGKNTKTLEGTATMLVVSLLISAGFFALFDRSGILAKSLSMALIATALEGFSPGGLDHLTVPLGVSLAYYLLLY